MNPWFFYFLKRSISQRSGRFTLAAGAVTLCVSVVTALAILSLGAREKIGAELKQYGANMMITDSSGGEIDPRAATAIRDLPGYIRGWSFQVYGQASIKQLPVEIMGTEPEHMTGYRIQGELPRTTDEVMVGVSLKDSLKLKPGDAVRFDESVQAFRVTAVFEKGSDEDSIMVMPIEGARKLLGKSGVNAILLNADTRLLRTAEAAVRTRFPLLQVKTLRQVAIAEERILGRIQLLMLLVTGVVLFSSMTALGSTMGATLIERMREIGIMKSLGAPESHIRNLFLSEAAGAGLVGGLAGFLLGVTAAEAVSKTAFGSLIPVNMLMAPFAVLLGLCIAVLATYLPVHDTVKARAAQILRGE